MELEQFGQHIRVGRVGKATHLIQMLFLGLIVCSLLLAKAIPTTAARITGRSITVGTASPSTATNYDFVFTINSTSVVGSIVLEFCDNSPLRQFACSPPSGMDATGVAINSQLGETGFSIGSATANTVVLTRAPVAVSASQVEYNLGNIINPSVAETIYVRIALYSSVDGSGSYSDEGGVAFATTEQLNVNAYVPPFLIFCTGITVGGDCSSNTGYALNLGELTPVTTRFATSQFSGATNDPGGYSTYITGTTMTAGNYVIPPLSSRVPSQAGVGQFGINLRSNSAPSVGADPAGPGDSTIMPSYSAPNLYLFQNGDQLTQSNISTDFNTFTVSYIVNIAPGQTPGHYASTITYTAVASF